MIEPEQRSPRGVSRDFSDAGEHRNDKAWCYNHAVGFWGLLSDLDSAFGIRDLHFKVEHHRFRIENRLWNIYYRVGLFIRHGLGCFDRQHG